MDQTIGTRIMENRKRLGLTQDQLAEKLGVTAQAVSKWENNQSCPDISIIPRLADIFGISTDELLGHSQSTHVFEGEIVDDDTPGKKPGNIEFSLSSGRKNGIGFAVFVLLVGALYLLGTFFVWNISLWSILWPSALLIFGIWGLYPRFSFFRLGCALVGGYNLFCDFFPVPITLSKKFILAAVILLFGISLLADAMKRPKKPVFNVNYNGDGSSKSKRNYVVNGTAFTFTSSFGSIQQEVNMDLLSRGTVSTSFGEFTLNLTGVRDIAPNAVLDIQNSFGELTILVPRKYKIASDHSTAFASFKTEGQPDSNPVGEIYIKSSVSFGEAVIRYI